MAGKRPPAKRARRANPREDRNINKHIDDILDFGEGGFQPNSKIKNKKQYRQDQISKYNRGEDSLNNSYKTKKVVITPRNVAQDNYLDTLSDEQYSIIFAMGPAGTGKTLLATQFAIKGLIEGRFKKIVITRPTVSTGEDIGFLPGSLLEKLTPWCLPIIDIFKEVFPVQVFEKMIKNEIVEIAPLGMMRGRTFKDCIIIADETQNALPAQMKMLLTRIGDNSRMIVTGDLRQHDRGFEANGLKDFVERLRKTDSNGIAVCEFDAKDVERHPVIEEVLRIYDET